MPNSIVENKSVPEQSVNIRVIKPNSLSSVWHWLTNRNRKANLQNLMYDEKFKLKLNPEELDALKRNGIDLQKLQALASNDGRMRKNIVIFSKDQSDLNKNPSLNSDLMKNKKVSKKPRKCKKSQVSLGSAVIRSKDNIFNSKITYIHSVKSKKSVNRGYSKASLKTGLKSKASDMHGSAQKNILMNGIPEELLKGSKQKRVFIPIYLGKKKSSISTKVNKNIGNESNIIPLLLTKLKKMEGKISDIENTTKKIKDSVSHKNLFDGKQATKSTKRSPSTSCKPISTHKLYSKKSLKKLKLNRSESKNKTITPIHSFSMCKVSSTESTSIENNKDTVNNIKQMLDNPKSFIKHHSFVIPNELSEKTLFEANPDASCDMILKLFESLTGSSSIGQTNDLHSNVQVVMGKQQNTQEQIQSELGSCKNTKISTSISDSHVSLFSYKDENKHKTCHKQKTNLSCPSSSIVMNYEDQNFTSNNATSVENTDSYSFETLITGNQNNLSSTGNETEPEKLCESENTEVTPLATKPWILFLNKDSGIQELEEDNDTIQENGDLKESEVAKKATCLDSSSINKIKSTSEEIKWENENEDHSLKTVHENSMCESSSKNNDDLNTKSDNSQGLKLHVSEGKIGKQVIKLPFGMDSTNICSICIEPAADVTPAKVSEIEVKGNKTHPEEKSEPKFSITILVKNNLSDDKLLNHDISTNSNPKIDNISSSEIGDGKECLKEDERVLPLGQGDGPSRCQQCLEGKAKESSRICVVEPPLTYDKPNVIPKNETVPTTIVKCDKDKGLNKLNSDKETHDFGIKGGSYINQEQRTKIEEQMSSSVSSKKTEELKNNTTKLGVKSSVNFKNDTLRHLSESSLHLTKPKDRNSYQRCRESPYDLLECFKLRKELGTINRVPRKYSDKKMSSGQAFDYINKALVGSKDDIYSFENSMKSISDYDVFNTIPSGIPDTTRYKHDFFVACKDKSSESPRNTEEFCLPSTKKRANRCGLTLKEPTSDNHTGDGPADNGKMGKGDHPKKNVKNISEIHSFEDGFEKNSPGFKLQNDDIPSIGSKSYIRASLREKPNFQDFASTSKMSNHNGIFCSQACDTKKEMDASKKLAIEYCVDEQNNDFDEPKVMPTNKNESADSLCKCDFVQLEPKSSNCSCVLTVLDEPHKRVDCELVTLSTYDLPRCCPCIVENLTGTTELITRRQAELLLQKCGQEPCIIWKATLLCSKCLNKCKNKDAVLGTGSTCSNTEIYIKQKKIDINNLEQDFNKGSTNANFQTCNEAIRLDSNFIDEKYSCLIQDKTVDLIDAKFQSEIKSSDPQNICIPSCFAICSDDSMCSEGVPDIPQISFCLDTPDSEFTEELEISKGIFQYYSDKNEAYSVENVANSTTILHFHGKEDLTFYRVIDNECCNEHEAAKENGIINSPNSNNSLNNIKHLENKFFVKINSKEDLSKEFRVVNTTTTQSKDQSYSSKSSLIAGDRWFGNVSPVRSTNIYTGMGQNKQNQYVEENSKATFLGNNTFSSYKSRSLRTIQDNDNRYNSIWNNPRIPHYIQQSKPQNVDYSTNYIVNCVRSIEFDIMDENKNSVFACSVNTFSSKNRKL